MRRPGARSFAAILISTLLVVLGGVRVPPASALGGWLRPVAGRVVRPFQSPAFRFGPGHLGVDFAAAPGSPARAAGAGTVVFAGVVAGTMHVVISHTGELHAGELHEGDLRTSYSFLASIRVRTGEEVARGAVIGTTGGRGDQHDGSVLHVGVRVGDTYIDPMQLFGPPDLTAVVRLAPVGPGGPGTAPAGRTAAALGLPVPSRALTLRLPVQRPSGAGIPVLFGRRTAVGTPLYPR
jgi:murein DD-endopeptidase MepM/ murein hydrolase activator NlpD